MQAESVRLVKYLSGTGTASRRGAGELVLAGRVAVNGEVTRNPGLRIAPGDRVTLDGKPLAPEPRRYYVMLNKPRGYTCSAADRHAEQLAVDLIDLPVRLFSAGRLDRDSEGLILFSNDGDFVERLTHPRHAVRKRYIVTTDRELAPGELEKMCSGIEDEGESLRAISARKSGERRYTLVLGEGRKREIRRMIARLGAKTLRLKRVAVGRLSLGTLPVGRWRELSPEECAQALSSASISE